MAKAKQSRPRGTAAVPLTLYGREGGRTVSWVIRREGTSVSIDSGILHSIRKPKTVKLATPAKAQAKYEALVAAQRALGFRELGEIDPPSVPIARDEALEAAIREHRDDPAPYLVYADWLQGQGCPLGEAIVLAQTKPKSKRIATIAAQLGLPSPDLVELEWRHGLWRSVRFHNRIDWMNGLFDPLPMARAVFASPLCAVLEELRLGIVRWDFADQPAILAEAGRHAWAKDLRRLVLGDVDDHIDMDHHSIGDVGKVITKSFPDLVELKVHSGDQGWRDPKSFELGGLALPRLRTLVVETSALTGKRLRSLLAGTLPALEHLELWFGDPERHSIATAKDAAPIWAGTAFPRLRHLGICNSTLAGDVIEGLPRGKLARQLETLDLSKGTLGEEDARALVKIAPQLPALRRLVLDESYLTAPVVRELKAAFPGVDVSAKDPKDYYDWAPGERFISVSE